MRNDVPGAQGSIVEPLSVLILYTAHFFFPVTYLGTVENSFGCRLWEALMAAQADRCIFLAGFQEDLCSSILALESSSLTSSQSATL